MSNEQRMAGDTQHETRNMNYDLCITWNWEYDADFVALLEMACRERGLSLLQITPDNLGSAWQALASGELTFRTLFDRASDDDPRFMPIVAWAREHSVRRINVQERARRAWDKATMHLEFIQAGLHVPEAIILPPYNELPELPSST